MSEKRLAEQKLTIADYEQVLENHRGLVRRLDVALNGSGAAKQASLCDIVAQVEGLVRIYQCPLLKLMPGAPEKERIRALREEIGILQDSRKVGWGGLDD